MTPITILVVDNQNAIEYLIKRDLNRLIQEKESLYQILLASNGQEALTILREKQDIEIAIIDLQLPELDGLWILREIARINGDIKTIVISDYSDFKNLRIAMNRGAFDFLTKPIDLEDFQATLEKALKSILKYQQQKQQLIQIKNQLLYRESFDNLTGLANRNCFTTLLDYSLLFAQENSHYHFAVFLIDLDRLKLINNSFGHTWGDEILKEVGTRLKKNLNPKDVLARIGGDEFGILTENVKNPREAVKLVKTIEQELSQPFIINDYKLYIQISIGINLAKQYYRSGIEILRDAELAMNKAKLKVQGNYKFFDPSRDTYGKEQNDSRERLELENELRQAQLQNEFYLNYQPIVDLEKGMIIGFEALARWCNPVKGEVSPNLFIPILEVTGLIMPVGYWVLETALAQLKIWQQKFNQPYLFMNINLSPLQLQDRNLGLEVGKILTKHQLNGHSIKLEITESCLLQNNKNQLALLKELKSLGIQICIDDFGTGYSSLSRLHEFPVDIIKIDRSFINRLDFGHLETVKLIIALGQSLKMDIVAEGIETKNQLDILKALQCNSGQGFLFAKPMKGESIVEIIKAQNLGFPIFSQ